MTEAPELLLLWIPSSKNTDVRVYVAIGQKQSTIAQVVEAMRAGLEHTTIVARPRAHGSDAFPRLTGVTIGEYFRDNGMHADHLR